jgi:cell division protein ZapD
VTQVLIYEHPLSERIRNFLRTQHLFDQARYRIDHCYSSWDPKDCVATLVTLLQLIDRTDLKSELLKEFERQINTFQRLSKTPSIPQETLGQVLLDCEKAQSGLRELNGIISHIKDHPIVQSVQQRLSLHGGICAFDLPLFHYWLHQPISNLQPQLKLWLTSLQPLENALQFLLHLIRTSQHFKSEVATDGFFQQNLDPQFGCQLVRIQLPHSIGIYPEISASKHRVNVRFVAIDGDNKKGQSPTGNVGFELACCAI